MTKRRNYTLWTVQVLLSLLFLFAGIMKLALPLATLTQQVALPGWFIRVIGVAEVFGALGLIVPGLLRTRQFLTPLAAAGLVAIMIGATIFTTLYMGAGPAIMPFAVGVLASSVAWNRSEIEIRLRRRPCSSPSES